MKRTFQGAFGVLCFAGTFLLPGVARTQARGNWTVTGGDAEHHNWQQAETKIAKDTIAGGFKFLWKIQLGSQSSNPQSFREPLLLPGVITGRGFKDMVLWADSSTLYDVDSELGTLVWKKDFGAQSVHAAGACAGSNIQIVMEAPRVIHFGVHHPPRVPHPVQATPPPAPADATRRIGVIPPRGYFGLKGVYVLTGDGYLHEQILATGLDYAPAVKFVSEPASNPSALNITGNTIYTVTGDGCRKLPHAAWSIDLSTPAYAVNSYLAHQITVTGGPGPAIGTDGAVYVETGSGHADPSRQVYPNSVVALAADSLKVEDWYAPSGKSKSLKATPMVFAYNDKELIVAAGKDESLVLLDSKSLGGADHHTPMTQTDSISKRTVAASFASWKDKEGASWVLASIAGPVKTDVKFASSNGPTPHGSIVAFKVEEKDGHTVLTPTWISRDLTNPAPPAIANGVVFALSGGNASTHAILYALDAATGKQMYSSGDAVTTYTGPAGMSIGDGKVFFTTHDNTLYSFGIPIEH